MRILGLDPGFGITGWGFVSFRGSSLNQPTLHSYGAMTTTAGLPLALRLASLQNQFVELLDRLQPDRVSMERLFFGKNITTAEGVYQARGVLLAALGQKKIVPVELTPNQIKQSITGSGKSRKPEMMRMVQMLLNISEPIRPDDAADALGCAIAASAISNLEYERLQEQG
ncbi:MAG: crossover junction endodeoxyribonuclease RuvC [Leptospiraceae bacterium]|nr:crossover junction endodeoxyribonuclease RuvC [Leptospiraceae bacterium]MCB1303126.1 crossover junction endodeoxyribonuclease RuvC [Leptospiraceae bacterium]